MDQGIREGSERGKKNRPLCRDDCGSYRQRGLCVCEATDRGEYLGAVSLEGT